MFLLFILVFQELFFSLFIIFWEVLTARTAPSGYSGLAKLDLSAALSYDAIVLHNPEHQNLRCSFQIRLCHSGLLVVPWHISEHCNFWCSWLNWGWFILFIFIGRILLVLSHKIGVPGWMQILVFTAASALLPLTGQLEPRLSPGAMSTEYTLMLIGAYVAPATCLYFAFPFSCFLWDHSIWTRTVVCPLVLEAMNSRLLWRHSLHTGTLHLHLGTLFGDVYHWRTWSQVSGHQSHAAARLPFQRRKKPNSVR